MRKNWLKKIIPLTLSAGILTMGPAFTQDVLPVELVCMAEAAAPEAVQWDVGKDMAGWKFGGVWAYNGEPEMAADSAFGGSIRIGADFTGNVNDGWSELKLENGGAAAQQLDLSGYNTLSFNLYYNPDNMTQGSFKLKLYVKSTDEQEVINLCPDVDLSKGRDAGNGMKCVPVQVNFKPVEAKVAYFCLSIVGCNTDYKGDFFVNGLKLTGEKLPDGYVDVRTAVKKQGRVQLNQLQLPAEAGLVDAQATPEAAQLFAYLQGIADSDKVLYGHQNELHKKVGKSLPGASDTEDMVGDHAAVMGLDSLALTGNELALTDDEKARGLTLSEKLADIYIPVAQKGAILTMSMHLPNFAEVQKRPLINGKYDFSGYSPNNLEGNVMQRILPGGDLNDMYKAYLDMVADFDGRLQAANIPLIFRPFHENNGSWFWWGASSCTPSEYRNVFRYTVEYLRDVKGLHNLLYAYSPGGPLVDEADYLSRYPGDAFIDVVGFDMYHRDPAAEDAWMDGFAKTIDVVQDFAEKHHKVAAVTECGMLYGSSALVVKDNTRLDWWNEAMERIAPKSMAYFLTWANFDDTNFDQPYMVEKKRGQELANGFIDFYNRPESVFMKDSADYRKVGVTAGVAKEGYGYLLTPGSYERVLDGMKLEARLGGAAADVKFVIRDKAGSILRELSPQISGGTAAAALSGDDVRALGAQVADLEVVVNGQVSDSVPLLLNMPAPAQNPLLVDDFDSYYGDNGLLGGTYNANTGSGCSVTPQLSEVKQGGEAGLAFRYSINKGGYAGIVKSLKNADWSSCNAVQLWVKPDGLGQKLIIQLNSNGEDFEVDLSQLAKTTEAQVITLPFADFKGKNGGTFDPSGVKHFGIYCNTIGSNTIDSVMYFDAIKAVKQ